MKTPDPDRPLRIFFSGIGGSGMSAIAAFMSDKGHVVSGSDRAFDGEQPHPARIPLQKMGITLCPQDGTGIRSALDLTVFSTAVEKDNPEFLRTEALGVPTATRPMFLAKIANSHRTVAVAGTSGKSTTSGMLAFIMKRLGMSPNFIGGGRVKAFRDDTHPGNECSGESDLLVMEACESDGTIVHYKPLHSLILNLDLDHASIEETAALFRTLAANTGGRVVINGDDPYLRQSGIRHDVSFSLHAPSRYRAEDIVRRGFGISFSVNGQAYTLPLPGLYNVYNAAACIAILTEMGVTPADTARAMADFIGIERRFDVHLCEGEKLVVDDYAHNPHKIASFIEMIGSLSPSVCYIFQPHGFGPARLMRAGYIETFARGLRPSDHLILLPIYYAGGTAQRTISSEDIAEGIAAAGRSVETLRRQEIPARVGPWKSYAILGARDESLSDLARTIAAALRAEGPAVPRS